VLRELKAFLALGEHPTIPPPATDGTTDGPSQQPR